MRTARNEVKDAVNVVAILTSLRERSDQTAIDLSRSTQVPHGVLYVQLLKLQAQGLIAKERFDVPLRYVYRLTDKGRRAITP